MVNLAKAYIDYGASVQLTANEEWLSNVSRDLMINEIVVANKDKIPVLCTGDVQITTKTDTCEYDIMVEDVLCVPKLTTNLLSVSQLISNGNMVSFNKNGCQIYNVAGDLVATASLLNGVYKLNMLKDCSSAAVMVSTEVWHRHLGHINSQYLNKMRDAVQRSTLDDKTDISMSSCVACSEGKQSRLPSPKEVIFGASVNIVYCSPPPDYDDVPSISSEYDIRGPRPTPPPEGSKYGPAPSPGHFMMPGEEIQWDFRGILRKLFAVELFLMNMNRNVICSPITASLTLFTLINGTEEGETRTEMVNALGFKNDNNNAIKREVEKFFAMVQFQTIVNRFFISKEFSIEKSFESHTTYKLAPTFAKIDFNDPNTAATTINEWVSSKTSKWIKKIIAPSAISKGTQMILVNTLDFSEDWTFNFQPCFDGDFYSPVGTKKVPMMTLEQMTYYKESEALNAKIIELSLTTSTMVIVLPESDSNLSSLLNLLKESPELLQTEMARITDSLINITMPIFKIETEFDLQPVYEKIIELSLTTSTMVIVLPESDSNLSSLLNLLKESPELLQTEMARITDSLINITMPIFKIETEFDLQPVYEKVGVKRIFQNDSGLTRIRKHTDDGNTDITLSRAIQRVYIDVGPGKRENNAPSNWKLVLIDRPFLFYVKREGQQVFAGMFNGR